MWKAQKEEVIFSLQQDESTGFELISFYSVGHTVNAILAAIFLNNASEQFSILFDDHTGNPNKWNKQNT